MREAIVNHVFKIILIAQVEFTAGFCYLPDMPFPGSYRIWSCRICPFPAINIYFGRGKTVVRQILNCRERAYPAAPYPAAAGKGHIRQVLESGSISNRATRKLSLIQVFSVAPLIFLKNSNGQTRLKKLYVARFNYTRLEIGFILGLKKVFYPRSWIEVMNLK